jgi:glyoxylase-like metal-dependent hydrolase (beta-lactamase superfamily II)
VTQIDIPGHDVSGIRAANPSPFTLTGTNSWIVGREPAWLVDPGPSLPDHVDALATEISARGGLGGIALTHDHGDHSDAVPAIRARFPGVPLAAGRGPAEVRLRDGARFGPLEAVFSPGHAPDHYAFLVGPVGLSGDAVLGEGSVFIFPDPGALAGYLEGLGRLRGRGLEFIGPGHGPRVDDPEAKLGEYIAHRLEREARLLEALAGGARSINAMLGAAWSEVPDHLRPAATVTLAAHLDKLAGEGRLPSGVERPGGTPLSEPRPR